MCAVGVCTSGTGDSRRGVGPRLLPLDIATRIRGGLSPRASPASGGLERCSGAPGAASGAVGPIVGRLIRTHRQPNSPTDFAEDPNKVSNIRLVVDIMTEHEAGQIVHALERIRDDIEQGNFVYSFKLEDIHTHIERALIERHENPQNESEWTG